MEQHPSKRRRRVALSAALGCVLAGAGAAVLLSSAEEPKRVEPRRAVAAATVAPLPLRAQAPQAPKPKPERKPKRKPERKAPEPQAEAPAPGTITVPAVGISAPIIPLGLTREGKLEVPKDISKAGWRLNGPEPGERGAAVITAHVNWNGRPGAFARLPSVSPGDRIIVRRRDGSTTTYVAERSERVAKDAFPTERVYGRTPKPTLRLITCGGSFDRSTGHYRQNVIVYARKA